MRVRIIKNDKPIFDSRFDWRFRSVLERALWELFDDEVLKIEYGSKVLYVIQRPNGFFIRENGKELFYLIPKKFLAELIYFHVYLSGDRDEGAS